MHAPTSHISQSILFKSLALTFVDPFIRIPHLHPHNKRAKPTSISNKRSPRQSKADQHVRGRSVRKGRFRSERHFQTQRRGSTNAHSYLISHPHISMPTATIVGENMSRQGCSKGSISPWPNSHLFTACVLS